MKRLFFIILLGIILASAYSQDIIYTVSGKIDNSSTPLDSILIENLENDERILFDNLPNLENYVVNLNTLVIENATGIINREYLPDYQVTKSLPGFLDIHYSGNHTEQTQVFVYSANGQLIETRKLNLAPYSNLSVQLSQPGIYIVKVLSAYGMKSFKTMGRSANSDISIAISSSENRAESFKKAIIQSSNADFNFSTGDSIRVTSFLDGHYARPIGLNISESENLNFDFKISSVVTEGISDAYKAINYESYVVTSYSPDLGEAEITYFGEADDLHIGDIVAVDLDSTGILQKITGIEDLDEFIKLQTQPASLNEVFVDKEFTLSTSDVKSKKSTYNTDGSQRFDMPVIDDEGIIHPTEIIVRDKFDRIAKYSPINGFNNLKATKGADVLDYFVALKGIVLDGDEDADVHFYLADGDFSVTSNAVFKLGFKDKGKIDKQTKISLGEIDTFQFYLESEANLSAKLALELAKDALEEGEIELFDPREVIFKFIVPPGIPVWVTVDFEINGTYSVSADASLKADWGAESTMNIKAGGSYSPADDSIKLINEFSVSNVVYPLTLSGEVNANARLEVVPSIEIEFYDIIGPYVEIVPYLEGYHNYIAEAQIGLENIDYFTAWNSGIDFGLDLRAGIDLSVLGIYEKELGSVSANAYKKSIWNSPDSISLLTPIPGNLTNADTLTLTYKVLDKFGIPSPSCPVYVSGSGSFDQQFAFTDKYGDVSFKWVGSEEENTIQATLYKADQTITQRVTKTISIRKLIESDFTASETEIIAGESISFTDLSTKSATSWNWDFGDGNTSTEQNPTHTYEIGDSYTVKLTVEDEHGSDTETKTEYINVAGPPMADFSAPKYILDVGEIIDLKNLSKGHITYWGWTAYHPEFGTDGPYNEWDGRVGFGWPGTGSVTLTVSNEHGSDSVTKTFLVLE